MLNPSNKPIARFYNKGGVNKPSTRFKINPAPFLVPRRATTRCFLTSHANFEGFNKGLFLI
nr:MAG TPA: hypothetical protein [Caudoviricetes sp.]